MGSTLTFAGVRKQFPIGATFTADFLSGNAARAGEANQHRRREVLTVTRQKMVVRYLTGPRRGETSTVMLAGHTVRLDNYRGIECLVFADDHGTDWYRVTHIVPRGVDASLEWHKSFLSQHGRHPNAIEYEEAGFGASGQCECGTVGECALLACLPVACDRNCYADQLRNVIKLGAAAMPSNIVPIAPLRRLKIISPADTGRGAIARDLATNEQHNLCYLCGYPRDEHKPNCPKTSATVIEDYVEGEDE